MVQGVRSDFEVARDPQTRSGFWWKTATVNLLPKLLMFFALLGFFGEQVRRRMQRATEYDRTNYSVIPLAEDDEQNTIYFRVPQDQTGQMIGGLFWKLLQAVRGETDVARALAPVVDYMGGQVPSLAPELETVIATGQMFAGQNPRDAFRSRNVLTDDEQKARGREAWQKFIGWEFQQLGGGVVWKFYPGEQRPIAQTRGQRILEVPVLSNIIGRFLRITNFGEVEAFRQVQAEVSADEARRRLNERAAVNAAIRTFQQAPSTKTEAATTTKALEIARRVYATEPVREQVQRARQIEKKLNIGTQRANGDALTDAVLGATSNDQKLAMLQAARPTMTPAEFDAWIASAVRAQVISPLVGALATAPAAVGQTPTP
jgi:hypothetical protein